MARAHHGATGQGNIISRGEVSRAAATNYDRVGESFTEKNPFQLVGWSGYTAFWDQCGVNGQLDHEMLLEILSPPVVGGGTSELKSFPVHAPFEVVAIDLFRWDTVWIEIVSRWVVEQQRCRFLFDRATSDVRCRRVLVAGAGWCRLCHILMRGKRASGGSGGRGSSSSVLPRDADNLDRAVINILDTGNRSF
ncbi:hypothetical protein AA313_de0200043 [Arthrobotrys entomopaga]|nr:hypothetical protein AA313_de0200043 [Arthrobotrys entomopaga]